jgi:predicted nucleic acid-binding protein
MLYLLDTNVISEMRKVTAGRGEAAVRRWAASVDPSALFLSAITMLEIQTGILLMARKDHVQGEVLRRWLHGAVLPTFGDRILVVDAEIAQRRAACSRDGGILRCLDRSDSDGAWNDGRDEECRGFRADGSRGAQPLERMNTHRSGRVRGCNGL